VLAEVEPTRGTGIRTERRDLDHVAHRPMHASADRMSGPLPCNLQMATKETIGPEEQHVHAPFLDCKTT